MRYRRVAGVVHVEWDFVQITAQGWWVPTALPAGFRPSATTWLAGCRTDGSHVPVAGTAIGYVYTSGSIGFQSSASVAGGRNCGVTSFAAA